MKTLLLLAASLALSLPALAQDPATARLENSPRHHEWVQLKAGERAISTFVVYPEVKTKALTVIVIHENRGLNDWARSVADRLAEEGYIALAPDLLSGKGPGGGDTKDFASTSDATRAIGQVTGAETVAALNAVADYAQKIPAGTGKVAVIGFCWGGSQTWRFAMNRPDLVLACPFYGTAPDDAEAFARIKAPVHGFYGGNDERVNSSIERTTAAMKANQKVFEPVIYEGARHAYMRASDAADADEANKKAATESWKRLLALLKQAN